MLTLKKWQSSAALMIAVTMTSSSLAPIALIGAANANPAPQTVAQLFPGQRTTAQLNNRISIPAGTVLPLTYEKDRIVLAPNERAPITLTVARNIRTTSGTLLIAAGSKVEGEFRPAGNGTQFVANTLVLTNGDRIGINATTPVVSRRETITKNTNVGNVIGGGAVGAGAAALLAGVTGNRRISRTNVLIGAGLGALGTFLLKKDRAEVVVVNPQSDLALTLNSPLALNF